MLYLSENLKKYRIMKNLTQEDVAEYLHITPQSVSKWERGIAPLLPLKRRKKSHNYVRKIQYRSERRAASGVGKTPIFTKHAKIVK